MDGSIRPGNPDRGWNDPPMFNFNTTAQPSPRSSLLNKRVAPPQQQTAPKSDKNAPPSLNSRMASAKSTPTDVSAPPLSSPPHGGGPPVTSSAPAPSADSSATQDDDVSLTLDRIQTVLNECENKLKKRIFDDITKRLGVLGDKWRNGNISNPVKVHMSKLANALFNYLYDEAFQIHLTLMVNHVTEVSQWMVGIKRLIHEAKTIRPKLEELPREESSECTAKDETQFQLFDTKNLQSSQPVKEITETITQENETDNVAETTEQEQS